MKPDTILVCETKTILCVFGEMKQYMILTRVPEEADQVGFEWGVADIFGLIFLDEYGPPECEIDRVDAVIEGEPKPPYQLSPAYMVTYHCDDVEL